MAFVVGPTDKNQEAKFIKYLEKQQRQVTEIQARNGERVFAVADFLLENLDNLSFPTRLISESELPEVLTPGGLSFYQRIKASQPELFTFDRKLPALGMRPVILHFREEHMHEVARILFARIGPSAPKLERCYVAGNGGAAYLYKIEFDFPSSECEALSKELHDRGVLGVCPLPFMFFGRDPER